MLFWATKGLITRKLIYGNCYFYFFKLRFFNVSELECEEVIKQFQPVQRGFKLISVIQLFFERLLVERGAKLKLGSTRLL